jgi:hypothetical protein
MPLVLELTVVADIGTVADATEIRCREDTAHRYQCDCGRYRAFSPCGKSSRRAETCAASTCPNGTSTAENEEAVTGPRQVAGYAKSGRQARTPATPTGERRTAKAPPVHRAVFETWGRIGPEPHCTSWATAGKCDRAMRGELSRTKTLLFCTPGWIRRGTGRRARLIGADVAGALVSVLLPALGAAPAGAADTSDAVSPIAWHRCTAGSAAAMAGGFLWRWVTAHPADLRQASRALMLQALQAAGAGRLRGA